MKIDATPTKPTWSVLQVRQRLLNALLTFEEDDGICRWILQVLQEAAQYSLLMKKRPDEVVMGQGKEEYSILLRDVMGYEGIAFLPQSVIARGQEQPRPLFMSKRLYAIAREIGSRRLPSKDANFTIVRLVLHLLNSLTTLTESLES